MRILFALLVMSVCVCTDLQSQGIISGRIIDGETKAPIVNASVFINSTSKGTITANDGAFRLSNIGTGRYELIISSIGYQTFAYPFNADSLPLKLEVHLEPRVVVLGSVTVEPFEKDGWERWGQMFLENFIGTNTAAGQCKLRNKEVLRFRFSKKQNRLTVYADEPLVVDNKALGYRVRFQLEEFSSDFSSNTIFYSGYPLFEDLSRNKDKIPVRYAKNREAAFNGSMLHFMRSLYDGQLAAQGFEVRRMKKIPNLEKERVRQIFKNQQSLMSNATGARVNISKGDSSDYYSRIMRQENEFDLVADSVLSADSLLVVLTSNEKLMYFPDYLNIRYGKGLEEPDYISWQRQSRKPYFQRSTIRLLDDLPVTIQENGSYMPPQAVMAMGYWGWSEKLSHLLPLDYVNTRDN